MMERATGVPRGFVRSEVSTVAVAGPPADAALPPALPPAFPFATAPTTAGFVVVVVVDVEVEVEVVVVGVDPVPA
jgi:hypothetical protein